METHATESGLWTILDAESTQNTVDKATNMQTNSEKAPGEQDLDEHNANGEQDTSSAPSPHLEEDDTNLVNGIVSQREQDNELPSDEPADNSLSSFDWNDLHERFDLAMSGKTKEEQAILAEFNRLTEVGYPRVPLPT